MAGVDDIEYLSLEDVCTLHETVMQATDDRPMPLIAEGSLASAIAAPQHAAVYEDADLIRQAAILAVHVAQAQAFLNGNKRTGFLCADVFLRINGHAYDGDPIAFAQQLEALAESKVSLSERVDRFEEWLRTQVISISEAP